MITSKMRHQLSVILIIQTLSSIISAEDAINNWFTNSATEDNNDVDSRPTPGTPGADLVVIHLDEKTNRILFDLFVEVFGNGDKTSTRIEVPVSAVAELYRNYTQEQLDSLRVELKKLDTRFDVVRRRADILQERFLLANIEYSLTRNLTKYERKFVEIGEQLLTYQKLVLKFTAGDDKPIDANSLANSGVDRTGRRSFFATIFDRFVSLLLGLSPGSVGGTAPAPAVPQNTEPLNSNQLNKIVTLMRALQSLNSVSGDTKNRRDVIKLQSMLYRLQQIQTLNRLANERQYLNSNPNLNPYRYEAVLNLVKLVGTASGQNQLQTILRMFTAPQTQQRVKTTNTLSQERLKQLMKAIEEQESRRRQEMENQRQKDVLQELLRNQNRQQQQIDGLIRLITQSQQNSNRVTMDNMMDSNDGKYPFKQTTTTTTMGPTTVNSDQSEIITKLRDQRRQLNQLLKTLGTDFNSNTNQNQNNNNNFGANSKFPAIMPAISGQLPGNAGNNMQAFTNILKSMAPMMGMLAQSGLVPTNQMQSTQKSLSELLNQSNYQNRIQYDSYKSNASKFIDLLGSILNAN